MNIKLKQLVDEAVNGLFNMDEKIKDPLLDDLSSYKSILHSAIIRHGNLLEDAYSYQLGIEKNNLKFKNPDVLKHNMVKPDIIYEGNAYELKRGISDADTTKVKGVIINLKFLKTKFKSVKLISHYGSNSKKYFRNIDEANNEFLLSGREEINNHFGFNIWDKVEEMTSYFKLQLKERLKNV